MKQFKNTFAVTGSQSLLKAFKEELINIGHNWDNTNSNKEYNYILVNKHDTTYYHKNSAALPIYSLPRGWDKALQLASKTNEYNVGDYVKADSHSPLLNGCGVCPIGIWEITNDKSTNGLLHSSTEAINIITTRGIWRINDNIPLATEEEIKDYLIQKAIKKGVVLGKEYHYNIHNTISKIKIKAEDYILLNIKNKSNFSTVSMDYFKTITSNYVLCIGSINYDNIPVENCIVNTFTFGGKPVTITELITCVSITCDGVTGTLDELKAIKTFSDTTPPFKFGSEKLKRIDYNDGTYSDSRSELPTNIKIGCLTGTYKEICNIIDEGKLLSK